MRHLPGWLGLVLMIALAFAAACNLSDPLTFTSGDSCDSDDDCGNGVCVESGGILACECDEFFEGSSCDECVDGRTLNDDGECVDDMIEPDMGIVDDEPCLAVTPAPLDFGPIELGRAAVLTATIENCSETEELTVDEAVICLEPEGDCSDSPVFALDTITPELPATLQPGESASARVRFTPVEGESTARLDVTAGALSDSVALSGSGLGEDCVEIAAEGRTMDDPTWGPQFTISPYQTVELRAVALSGPAGSIQRHEWSLASSPMGSNPRLNPNNTVASPTLFVDLPGEYVIEVTTFNADDEPSCDPATVVITAGIDVDIWVEIVWDTPNDPDQTDNTGSNVDLHFMHPNGAWNQPPWDVFSDNPTPDWTAGGAAGMPMLVRSDNDGRGPEYVVLDGPEEVNYRVGAYHRNPNGFGPSTVTMRAYVGGTLVYTGSATIALREFWFAGAVSWANMTFIESNQISTGFP